MPERIRRGYTLVEVLVVIAILGVLVGLTLSAVQRVRAGAARAACLNNLHQLGLAGQSHAATHGHFPAGMTDGDAKEKFRHMGWTTRLLPYMEQDALWQLAVDAFGNAPFIGNFPKHPCDRVLSLASCPADPRTKDFHANPAQYNGSAVALSSYLGVNGTNAFRYNGVSYVDSKTRPTDITDGTSNTLFIGERPPSPDRYWGWWYASWGSDGRGTFDLLLGVRELSALYPEVCDSGFAKFGPGRIDNPCDTHHFWSTHQGGANFAFADGSVRFLRHEGADTLPALATRSGGEVTGE